MVEWKSHRARGWRDGATVNHDLDNRLRERMPPLRVLLLKAADTPVDAYAASFPDAGLLPTFSPVLRSAFVDTPALAQVISAGGACWSGVIFTSGRAAEAWEEAGLSLAKHGETSGTSHSSHRCPSRLTVYKNPQLRGQRLYSILWVRARRCCCPTCRLSCQHASPRHPLSSWAPYQAQLIYCQPSSSSIDMEWMTTGHYSS